MISPSGRVPEQAPDWFFLATEAFGSGTSDLGFFLEVSIFIRIFGIENKSRRCPRDPEARGAPSTLVVASGIFWPSSDALWASSGP